MCTRACYVFKYTIKSKLFLTISKFSFSISFFFILIFIGIFEGLGCLGLLELVCFSFHYLWFRITFTSFRSCGDFLEEGKRQPLQLYVRMYTYRYFDYWLMLKDCRTLWKFYFCSFRFKSKVITASLLFNTALVPSWIDVFFQKLRKQ